MQVSVTFRHIEPTEALKKFATEKVTRIEKYVTSSSDATIVLSVEKYMHQADITIKAHGMLMRGKDKSEDMYVSIDGAVSKIERQVKRYRNKITSHKPKEGQSAKVKLNILEASRLAEQHSQESAPVEDSKPAPTIVETKEVSAKPMTVEDAMMQIDLMNSEFLVFVNAKSNAVNVLYRRGERNFGLIETPASP
jgi:putative sigma-54 modulation protein